MPSVARRCLLASYDERPPRLTLPLLLLLSPALLLTLPALDCLVMFLRSTAAVTAHLSSQSPHPPHPPSRHRSSSSSSPHPSHPTPTATPGGPRFTFIPHHSPPLLPSSSPRPQSSRSSTVPSPHHAGQEQLLLSSSFSLSSSASSSSSFSLPAPPAPPPSAPYTYADFSHRMKDPLASSLVKRLKSFVRHISSRPPPPSSASLSLLRREVHAFLHATSATLPSHPLFAASSASELLNAAESMEKFVLSKLHSTLYLTPPSDLVRNQHFNLKCQSLAWLTPYHLELPASFTPLAYATAQEELRRMGEYKAPKDKLICLLNACHLMSAVLEEERRGAGVGADDLFPVFIYVLVHARVERFVHDVRWVGMGSGLGGGMKGECDYWVTMADSAVVFIETMTEAVIRVHHAGEWDQQMAATRQQLRDQRRKASAPAPAKRTEEEKRLDGDGDDRSIKAGGDREREEGESGEGEDSEGLLNHNISSVSNNDSGVSDKPRDVDEARHRPPAYRPLTVYADDDGHSSSASFSSTLSSSPASSPISSPSPLVSPVLLPYTVPHPPPMSLNTAVPAPSLHYVDARVDDLQPSDVARLLTEYKEMAGLLEKLGVRKGP